MSVVIHLCVCLYVCNCMRMNLYLCKTPIYFSNFMQVSHSVELIVAS